MNINLTALTGKRFLLAHSGGLDSIVLANLLLEASVDFSVAHCNFQLRGSESDDDFFFVEKWCQKHSIPFFSNIFSTKAYMEFHKKSTQLAARELRYEWFNCLLAIYNFEALITAHHLNDQLETFFINTTSGLENIISPETNKLIRPLLNYTKEELLAYANENNLKWNEDKSNLKNDYFKTQTFLSLNEADLINIEKYFQKTINHIGDASKALNIQIDDFKKKFFINIETGIKIDLKDINKLSPKEFFLHAIFKQYGFIHPLELEKLINSSPGKLISSDSHELLRDRECLILRKKIEQIKMSHEINLIPQKLKFPFNIEISLEPLHDIINSIEVDPSLLNSILEIKKPYVGAYFYPTGMSGRKKLSKYFKNYFYVNIYLPI